MKNFIIAGHEHSTRDSRGQRLISINPVVTEQNQLTELVSYFCTIKVESTLIEKRERERARSKQVIVMK